jgi:hypothetical protein
VRACGERRGAHLNKARRGIADRSARLRRSGSVGGGALRRGVGSRGGGLGDVVEVLVDDLMWNESQIKTFLAMKFMKRKLYQNLSGNEVYENRIQSKKIWQRSLCKEK